METLIEYALKSAGVLLLFVAVYHLLLKRLTFFNANRWFLLAGLLASVVFPLVEITQTVYVEAPQEVHVPQQVAIPMAMILEQPSVFEPVEEPGFDLGLLAQYAYLAVVFFFLGKMAVELSSLVKLVRGGVHVRRGGFVYVTLSRKLTPFSFFNYICYSAHETDREQLDLIIDHEKVHAKQWHSVDLLVSHLYRAVFWWNPLAWIAKKQIGENLEFIADAVAKRQHSHGHNYERALLSRAASHMQPALANNFFTPFIKQRILMLQKEASATWNAYKYALILPIMLVFIYSFNRVQEIEYVESKPAKEVSNEADTFMKLVKQDLQKAGEQTHVLSDTVVTNSNLLQNALNPGAKVFRVMLKNFLKENNNQSDPMPLLLLNGKVVDVKFLKETINEVGFNFKGNFLIADEAIKIYGEAGKNGAFVIDTDNQVAQSVNSKLTFDINANTTDKELDSRENAVKNLYTYEIKFENRKRDAAGKLQELTVMTKFPSNSWKNQKAITFKDDTYTFSFINEGIMLTSVNSNKTLVMTAKGSSEIVEVESENKPKVSFTASDVQYTYEDDNNLEGNSDNAYHALIESSTLNAKPLIIVDGVVVTTNVNDLKLKADQILKATVLKGKEAKDKYGDAGVNGVVEIVTKSDPSVKLELEKNAQKTVPVTIAERRLGDFKIIFNEDGNRITMKSLQGTAWKELSFTLSRNKEQAINAYGMINLNAQNDKVASKFADFIFTVTRTRNGYELKGIKGTAWTNLRFSIPKKGKQAVNQFGTTTMD